MEDLEKVMTINGYWTTISVSNNHIYVYSKLNKILLHRFILDAPKGKVVDHINHNTLDNKKINIRVLSHSENMQNRVPCVDSKSGIRGVHWCHIKKRWVAEVVYKGKRVFRKYCRSLDEAAMQVTTARKILLEFSNEEYLRLIKPNIEFVHNVHKEKGIRDYSKGKIIKKILQYIQCNDSISYDNAYKKLISIIEDHTA